MGGDACVTFSNECRATCDPKVWRAGCFLIGCCGDTSFQTLLQMRLNWPSDLANVLEHITVSLPAEMRRIARQDAVPMPEGAALIACKGDLYLLDTERESCDSTQADLSVERVTEQYAAVGSGAEIGLGALYATRGAAPMKRLVKALEAASLHRGDVAPPFTVLSL